MRCFLFSTPLLDVLSQLQKIIGIHNGQSGVLEDGDINAVARSKNRSLMVCGGSNTIDSSVKLFRFPTLLNSLPNVYLRVGKDFEKCFFFFFFNISPALQRL